MYGTSIIRFADGAAINRSFQTILLASRKESKKKKKKAVLALKNWHPGQTKISTISPSAVLQGDR